MSSADFVNGLIGSADIGEAAWDVRIVGLSGRDPMDRDRSVVSQ